MVVVECCCCIPCRLVLMLVLTFAPCGCGVILLSTSARTPLAPMVVVTGCNRRWCRISISHSLSRTCAITGHWTWVVHVQIPNTRSAAQATMRYKGKNDWQLNDFSIFLSLLLRRIIHVPCHIHHLAYRTYIHTFSPSLLCYYSSHKLLHG